MNAQLIEAIEEERSKIAREMHDEAGQLLITAAFRLDQAMALLPETPAARELLNKAREALDECAEALQRLAFNLRPRLLDDLGLLPAIRSYLNRYANLESISLDVDLEEPPQKLNPTTELAIFRILQESIANVQQHSEASLVRIRLAFTADQVELEVSDNGVGFDSDAVNRGSGRTRLGLLGMRERATAVGGVLRVESQPHRGAAVRAIIPIRDKPDEGPGPPRSYDNNNEDIDSR